MCSLTTHCQDQYLLVRVNELELHLDFENDILRISQFIGCSEKWDHYWEWKTLSAITDCPLDSLIWAMRLEAILQRSSTYSIETILTILSPLTASNRRTTLESFSLLLKTIGVEPLKDYVCYYKYGVVLAQ